MSGPNPLAVLLSILRARRTRRPQPGGTGAVDHSALDPILDAVATGGVGALPEQAVDRYLIRMSAVDPDALTRDEALAFWLNTYNAGALALANRALRGDAGTVLRVAGGFTRPFLEVAGEDLSLDDIEHGKIRRFGDPRIHAALVCGSVSCPTLRVESYRGDGLDAQLDDQMRHFLASGAAAMPPGSPNVALSRVFRWYGADFVRPHRMPTLLPAPKRAVMNALRPWMEPRMVDRVEREHPSVSFQEYDWGLSCTVRPAAPAEPEGPEGEPHYGGAHL